MSLGASPLTAYFTPSGSSSAKRKEPPVSVPTRKNKNPRNDDTPAEPSGSKKGKTTKKPKPQAELKQRMLPFGGTRSTSPGPSTPSVGHRREYAALQTPTSIQAGARVKSKPKPIAKPLRAASPSIVDLTIESTSYLPTPATKPRPKARATVPALPAETPSKYTAPDPSTSLLSRHTTPDISRPSSPLTVPSSQSQPELGDVPPERSPEPNRAIDAGEDTEPDDSEPIRIPDFRRNNDFGSVVASSQSQFLVPFELSPRKKRHDGPSLLISTRQPEVYDTIPSSQSYEEELQIPKPGDNALLAKRSTPHRHRPSTSGRGWTVDQKNAPARTLSDEMFSVPISSAALDNLLEEDDHQPERVAPAPAPSPTPRQGEDDGGSTTETDTDDEWPYVYPLPKSTNPIPVPNYTSNPAPGNHEDNEDVTQDDSPLEAPISLSQVSNLDVDYSQGGFSQNADDSPGASLPPVLQEFRDMFGDGDESYPPDFPMSLRT